MPALLADFAQVFTTAEVFTPLDLAALGNRWPSIQDMLAGGKRLLVVSGVDYLTPMAPLIFSRCSPCCAVPPLRPALGCAELAATSGLGWCMHARPARCDGSGNVRASRVIGRKHGWCLAGARLLMASAMQIGACRPETW